MKRVQQSVTHSDISSGPGTMFGDLPLFGDLPIEGTRRQVAACRFLGWLFGIELVQDLRASGFEWLVGRQGELPIPEYSSLAQRRGTVAQAGAAFTLAGGTLRAVTYPDLPVPLPPTLDAELRAFLPPALRTSATALAAALLVWAASSLPQWVGGFEANALPTVAVALPEDRTFTAEMLLPAQGVAFAAGTVTDLDSELAVVNPANQPAITDNGETSAPVAATMVMPAIAEAPAAPAAGTAAANLPDSSGSSTALGLGGGVAALATQQATAAPAWPFSIEIVTPTPNAEAQRLLFAEPLVAQERSEAAALALGADNLLEPILLPAIASQAGDGAVVPAPSLRDLAQPRVVPAEAFAPVLGLVTPQPTAEPVPTAPAVVLEPGRAWSTFIPAPDSTHFWVGRPHPDFVQNQIAAPSYQFGSTAGGRYRVHHGMDIANPVGTPVRAATTGEVIHAGLDDPDVLGPYPNFYGNTVVIRLDRRLIVAGGEMDVFLLYGHLNEVTVQKGQRVQPNDIVGAVGMTGIAIGPHLHVEMRVGANIYEASVNPYLWVEPPPGHGAVAVRLLTADGRTWPNARLTLASFSGNQATWARVIEVYPDNESVNPNPSFGENGAMEAVPAGTYFVIGAVNGERVAAEVTVEAGKTAFVELRTAR